MCVYLLKFIILFEKVANNNHSNTLRINSTICHKLKAGVMRGYLCYAYQIMALQCNWPNLTLQ